MFSSGVSFFHGSHTGGEGVSGMSGEGMDFRRGSCVCL